MQGITWEQALQLLRAYQCAECLEGDANSARILVDAKYLAEKQGGARHDGSNEGPVAPDEAAHVFFGKVRQALEKVCEQALGEKYMAFDLRLFCNGAKKGRGGRRAQGPHKDGKSWVKREHPLHLPPRTPWVRGQHRPKRCLRGRRAQNCAKGKW